MNCLFGVINMNEIRKKLESLGYYLFNLEFNVFTKERGDAVIRIRYDKDYNFVDAYVCKKIGLCFRNQKQLDDLQIAFNTLKSDLKELENEK